MNTFQLNQSQQQVIIDQLSQIRFGELLNFSNLSILPVFNEYAPKCEYLTLQEALDDGEFSITEMDESGDVSHLRVQNLARRPVLLLAGDELIGAKQNRMVNITILIASHSEQMIPVSCVEEGRWSYRSRQFMAGGKANVKLRQAATFSIRSNAREHGVFRSNQHAVWEEVGEMLCDFGVESQTHAMADGYLKNQEKMEQYQKNLA